MSDELLLRIDRAEASSWEHGIEAMLRAQPGHARESHVLACGATRAFATPDTHVPMFNRVLGLTASDLGHLDAILAFYATHQIPARFDLCTQTCSNAVRAALTARGFEPSAGEFHSRRLWALPEEITPPPETVEVRRLTRDTIDTWLAIDEVVWPGARGDRRARLLATLDAPRFHRFLAHVDVGFDADVAATQPPPAQRGGASPEGSRARPAVALGRLEIVDRVALCNGAGTLPAHRRKGCQASLISRRLRVAQEVGCDVITALVTPGSSSDRNLQRCGLHRHADREVWQLPRWHAHPFYAT